MFTISATCVLCSTCLLLYTCIYRICLILSWVRIGFCLFVFKDPTSLRWARYNKCQRISPFDHILRVHCKSELMFFSIT